jgi:hypothetical protein
MTTKQTYLLEAALQADADATELAEFGEGVPVDPDVAEHMGAFREKALTAEDTYGVHDDLIEKSLTGLR